MGWDMGWGVHNDGRTLRSVREEEYSIIGGISEMPAIPLSDRPSIVPDGQISRLTRFSVQPLAKKYFA